MAPHVEHCVGELGSGKSLGLLSPASESARAGNIKQLPTLREMGVCLSRGIGNLLGEKRVKNEKGGSKAKVLSSPFPPVTGLCLLEWKKKGMS